MDVHRFGTGPILEDSRVVRTFALTVCTVKYYSRRTRHLPLKDSGRSGSTWYYCAPIRFPAGIAGQQTNAEGS